MNSTPSTAVAIACALVFAGSSAYAYSGENLESQAHVKMTEALALASAARPGKVTDRELEREKGGSGLRYSFDIVSGGVGGIQKSG